MRRKYSPKNLLPSLAVPSSLSLPQLLRQNSLSLIQSKSLPLATTQTRSTPPAHSEASTEWTEASVDFILSGPLLSKIGLSEGDILSSFDEWRSLGLALSRQLGFDIDHLSNAERIRVFHYYLPVFFWCRMQLEEHQLLRAQDPGAAISPLIIGISAPQGCGKTTVVESLEFLFHLSGRNAASISIDDFYLTFDAQCALALKFPDNRLLELRGNAGSHDMALGTSTLSSLKELSSPGFSVKLPRYDKSANQGRGDRANPATWPIAKGPLDVVLFEGWMLGFQSLSEDEVAAVDHQLVEVNRNLGAYEEWHKKVDAWIIIQVDDTSCVFNWRLQAEVQMRKKGKPGMSNEEVQDFVSRYMPAYKAYLPQLYKIGPKESDVERTLYVKIDASRSPIG